MKAASSSAHPLLSRTFRWSLMSGAVFWAVVYKLSESGIKVPDFVYVNF